MEEPEAVHPFDISVSGGSGFELNLHKLSCERPWAEDELCTSTDMTENAVNKIQQASYYCSVIKNDNVVDEEVGVDETFHLQISHEQHAGHDPTSKADKVSNFEDISLCKELILSDVRMQKCLIKSATFPFSEVDSLNFFNPGINGSSSCSSAPVQNSSSDQLPTYKRSTSLPEFGGFTEFRRHETWEKGVLMTCSSVRLTSIGGRSKASLMERATSCATKPTSCEVEVVTMSKSNEEMAMRRSKPLTGLRL